MEANKTRNYIKEVLQNMPADWLNLTTHRLDIYNESLAKTQFLAQFEHLFLSNNALKTALNELPTAYDYIRLGHPLSCVLEWAIARLHGLKPENVISFSSNTTPILAVLRKNLLANKNTRILYSGNLPASFEAESITRVYGYNFEVEQIKNPNEIAPFNGSTIFVAQQTKISASKLNPNINFYVNFYAHLGSVLLVNGAQNESYISEIQHVRRRETIAMTPANTLLALQALVAETTIGATTFNRAANKASVLKSITTITNAHTKALVGSSGLSVQYAIMMGLVHDAQENYPKKTIKFVVPPNCYGGTNDQARRVAACLKNVDVVDFPVDGGNDMVQSIDQILDRLALEDAVPYIIAEIPTNPRVEVPDLLKLNEALSKTRKTANGQLAIHPVFILDQTFCPNVHFLGEADVLSTVKTIAYVSGSKFHRWRGFAIRAHK